MAEDFDNPWKEALDHLFEPFLALLFPAAHAEIDWSRGYQSMDKELRQAIRDIKPGPRVVELLAKVWRKNGSEEWVLIHIEVQGKPQAAFPERMFIYCRRLIELHRRPVASFAVLTDERASWRPSEFGYNLFGCELKFRFPTVKLLDLRKRRAELEASSNPFASVVLAHLDTQATRRDPAKRKAFKFELVRRLYERNVPRERVQLIFRVIDWLMALPATLEAQFREKLYEFEQERQMPYVTSIERLAKKEGIEEGLVRGLRSGIEAILRSRFGRKAAALTREIEAIESVSLLRRILRTAERATSADDLRKMWS